ncbi:MAG TPA: DctP family TRAP transporter solute-binding subunit [Desulfomonilaceae bacterium]|nr:DctP family TRAP transporter solute-binding subunit [Desulfomonilaceae bacterium]
MKRPVLVLSVFILIIGSWSIPAAAQPLVAKYGHVAPLFHGQSKAAETLAAYVKEKTNGAVEVQTFPAGQLGGETSLAEQVQSGTIQIATISTAVLQNAAPQVAVLDLPFVFPNKKTAYAVLDDPEVQKKIWSYLPAKGFVPVGWTENGFRDVTNSKREIRKPDDLKGLKIRVMTSPIYMDTFKQLGASPVDLPFPEIYSALQNGTIDAQENPLLTSVLIKATEINKFVTKTDHVLTECIVVVNPEFWAKLTPDQQKIFYEGAAAGIKVNREVNEALEQKLPQSGLSIEEYCKQSNVKLTGLTAEERANFQNATKPIWATYKEKIGPELFDFFLAKVKSHSGN